MVAPRHAAGDLKIDDAVMPTLFRRMVSRMTMPSAAGDIGIAMRSAPSERSSRAICRRSSTMRPPRTSQTS